MKMKSVYRWTAGVLAGLSLALAVNEYRQTDPFANLNPNSPVAPIVRDVFENGQTDGRTKKKNYCLVPRPSGDDFMDAEIELDQHGYPTGGLKLTTMGPAPMDRVPQYFPDLDGDGDCDGDNPDLDKRYEKMVDGMKKHIKYRNLAGAVFDYVEKNGKQGTVWEPLFPNIKILSFLGRNVRPQDAPTILYCNLEDESVPSLIPIKSFMKGSFGGPELVIAHPVHLGGYWYVDPTVSGYAGHDRETDGYRKRLEQVARKFGIEVE